MPVRPVDAKKARLKWPGFYKKKPRMTGA